MEVEKIKRNPKREVVITLRCTKEISEWMKENNVSPTALFHESATELMKKDI